MDPNEIPNMNCLPDGERQAKSEVDFAANCSVESVLERLKAMEAKWNEMVESDRLMADPSFNKHDAAGWRVALEEQEEEAETLADAIATIQRLNDCDDE